MTHRLFLLLAAFTVFGLPAANRSAMAQDETALVRKAVAEINRLVTTAAKTVFAAKRPDVGYTSDVKSWSDPTGVRKIEVTDHDDDGDVVTEYFFTGGSLVFAYQAIKGFGEAGRQATRNEERQYFRDGRMVKWISGMADRTENAPRLPDFATAATERLAIAQFYLTAARKASAPSKE